jgi:hypothetical protein
MKGKAMALMRREYQLMRVRMELDRSGRSESVGSRRVAADGRLENEAQFLHDLGCVIPERVLSLSFKWWSEFAIHNAVHKRFGCCFGTPESPSATVILPKGSRKLAASSASQTRT